MITIPSAQYGIPCVIADDTATAQAVINLCQIVKAIRDVDGTEYCVQLRPDIGPELWTERALRRSLPGQPS